MTERRIRSSVACDDETREETNQNEQVETGVLTFSAYPAALSNGVYKYDFYPYFAEHASNS